MNRETVEDWAAPRATKESMGRAIEIIFAMLLQNDSQEKGLWVLRGRREVLTKEKMKVF